MGGPGESDWHGGVGRGPLHAEVHGPAWRRQGGGFRSHHRLHVQGLQAKGSEEKREMEAELRADLNSRDAPFHEAFRLLRVSQGHTALRRVQVVRRILRYGIIRRSYGVFSLFGWISVVFSL